MKENFTSFNSVNKFRVLMISKNKALFIFAHARNGTYR